MKKGALHPHTGPRKPGLAILAVTLFILCAPAHAFASKSATVLLLGDSIAAGYGLAHEDGLSAQLSAELAQRHYQIKLQNAGVSGDTSAGGLARLDWALTPETEIIIIVLGGNDALRAIPASETRKNLGALIEQAKARNLKVLLTGMRAPPNLGAEYAAEFEPIYAELAEQHHVSLYPFILEGVAADPALNQEDGIHPNAEGVKIIVAGLAEPLIQIINELPEPENQ
jgi:acyl-CoA thioesterase-1